jgi:E3 ubiquitin-protein ligase RNF13
VAGSSSEVHIYAVFISKASGEVLKKYSGQTKAELWIIPTYENSAWSIMAISFISLLAMSAVLATCFFVRRHQIRRDRARIPRAREFHGMSSQLVKAMPSLIFTKVQEDNCTSSTCAICLEDYTVGEKLRVLPCRHSMYLWHLYVTYVYAFLCSRMNRSLLPATVYALSTILYHALQM